METIGRVVNRVSMCRIVDQCCGHFEIKSIRQTGVM